MNPHQLDALRSMSQSRMGIYEHQGTEGGHVRLRELSPTGTSSATAPRAIGARQGNSGTSVSFRPWSRACDLLHRVHYALWHDRGDKKDRIDFLKRNMVSTKAQAMQKPSTSSSSRSQQELLE